MKNRIYVKTLSLLVFVMIMYSCQKKFVAPNSFSGADFATDPYILRDSINAANGFKARIWVETGGQASFADLSIGVKGRTFMVQPNSGDILNSDNDTASNEQKITVKYAKPGEYFVRLISTLNPDSVGRSIKKTIVKSSTGADSAVYSIFKIKGILDTTVYVHVFDTLKTNFATTTGKTTFEAGTPITFTSTSRGEPTNFTWAFPGSSTSSSGKTPTVVYKRSGTYAVSLKTTRAAILRNTKAVSDSLTKTAYITIVPSSQPLVYTAGSIGTNAATGSNFINISFNQEIISLPSTSEFSLSVDGVKVPISNVQYANPADQSILTLNLSNPLPSASLLKLTSTTNIKADSKNLSTAINATYFYAGSGNIFPFGYGNMEGPPAFTSPVTALFSTGGYSATYTGTNYFWRVSGNGAASSASTDAINGTYSMLFTPGIVANTFVQDRFASPYIPMIPGKKYRILAFVKSSVVGGSIKMELWNQVSSSSTVVVTTIGSNTNLPADWTKLEATNITVSTTGSYYVRFTTPSIGPAITYKIDEINVYEVP